MASGKYGTIITDMKGSIGGTTFKGTRSGAVVQNKINSNPSGKYGGKSQVDNNEQLIRSQLNFTQNLENWKNLSDVDRQTWVTGAVNFPFVNKFGEQYTPSAFQLFMSCNQNLYSIGAGNIATCPPPTSPSPTPGFVVSSGGGFTFNISGASLTNYSQILFATAPMSTGRNFVASLLKAITIFNSSTVFPQQVDSAYSKVFGTIPTGGYVWFEMRIVHDSYGLQGQPYRTAFVW